MVPAPQLVYARIRNQLPSSANFRPALFLDRDGVVNVDVGYAFKIEDLEIRKGIADRIASARQLGHEVIIVTNQSGIGRGFFSWYDFEEFQLEIERRLLAENSAAQIGLVLACPFHAEADAPYDVASHPWRKPNPGMILFAAEALGIKLEESLMLGDRKSDEEAAIAAEIKFEYVY